MRKVNFKSIIFYFILYGLIFTAKTSLANNSCESIFKLKPTRAPSSVTLHYKNDKDVLHDINSGEITFSDFKHLKKDSAGIELKVDNSVNLMITNGQRAKKDPHFKRVFDSYIKLTKDLLLERTDLNEDRVNEIIQKSSFNKNSIFMIITDGKESFSGIGSFYSTRINETTPLETHREYQHPIQSFSENKNFIEFGKFIKSKSKHPKDKLSFYLPTMLLKLYYNDQTPIGSVIFESSPARARLYSRQFKGIKKLHTKSQAEILYGARMGGILFK